MKERDDHAEALDVFAWTIGKLLGVDVGEHSNNNDPHLEALTALNREIGVRYAATQSTRPPEVIQQAIAAMPSNGEWWHPDNGETFEKLALRMLALGVPKTEVIDILTSAYSAVADEFGG